MQGLSYLFSLSVQHPQAPLIQILIYSYININFNLFKPYFLLILITKKLPIPYKWLVLITNLRAQPKLLSQLQSSHPNIKPNHSKSVLRPNH